MAGRCCCKTKPVIVASVSASTGPSTRRPTAAADAPPSPLSVRACTNNNEERFGPKTNTIRVGWKCNYEAWIVGLGSHRHGGGGLEARLLGGHHVAQRLQQLLVHHL